MNKKFIAAALLGSAILAFAGNKNSDPVLMTIDGQDIKLSEFEYLYNKNNMQQADPVTFDQYVDMFIDYKLKVADARAAGIDTTAEFREELAKYCKDLATPYLCDQQVKDELIKKVYDRLGEEVMVSHIMFNLPSQVPEAQNLADSVYNLLKTGEITFENAAKKYSIDKASARRNGVMGWVTPNGRYPWQFEDACYDTPLGEISPIINSGFGLHIIRVDEKRPTRGEVNVQHILLLTQNVSDPEEKAKIKERIDSIYNAAIQPGADFDELAKSFSEDPGSAQRGGRLDWFGPGMMVPEFEEVSYDLPIGGISKPFATSYGYHIVHKLGQRGGANDLPSYDEAKEKIEAKIEQDSRAKLPYKAYIDNVAKQSKSSVNPNLKDEIIAYFKSINCIAVDSASFDGLKKTKIKAYTINGKATPLLDIIKTAPVMEGLSPANIADFINNAAVMSYEKNIHDFACEQLELTNTDYRNLVNEYRDGIMLFDISNKKVWKQGADNPEMLEEYFLANRDKYTWSQPRFKSYVIFATNDSIAEVAKAYIDENYSPRPTDHKAFVADIKKQFARDIKVERVLASKGENPYTDYLAFGGERPNTEYVRWPSFFAFDPQIIDQPQEVLDVKGAVTADYQADLEKAWLQILHATHKVKINKKTLDQARKNDQKHTK